MAILNYSSKEKWIGAIMIFPIAVLINYFLFGPAYFDSVQQFLVPLLITSVFVIGIYITCSMIAVILQNRYTTYRETLRRIGLEMAFFVLVTFIAITILFYGYDYVGIL